MRKNLLSRLAVGLLALGLACGAERLGWLDGARNFYQDIWHCLAGQRYTPRNVVIASVDDASLLEFKDDPLAFWGPHFAKAIATLRTAGARAVGLDFLYSVSVESWLGKIDLGANNVSRTYDAAFREELASGQVVLAGFMAFQKGQGQVMLPIEDYLFALPGAVEDLGLTNLLSDSDGVARRYVLAMSDEGGYAWPSFPRQIALKSGADPDAPEPLKPRPIGFAGPPGSFKRISFARLVAPGAENDPEVQALAGKSVIVSLENSGMQDIHLSPYSRSLPWLSSRLMSGAEVQANILESMLGAPYPREAGAWLELSFAAAAVSLGAALFFRLPPWQGLAGLLGLLTLLAGASWLSFLNFISLGAAQAQLGAIFCYLGAIALRLGGEVRKRAKLRQIFGRYVSQQIVDALAAGEELPDLGGDTFSVTVLFSDIRNFTTISEKLSPKEVVEMLNTYFSLACQPILEQGGMVDKFIGDAIMAVFGAPARHPDHALRAAKAALDIEKNAKNFREFMHKRFAGRDLPDFAVGVGLHCGEAVVGNIGSPQRLDFTAIGDTVNTASRLEGLCKELRWSIVASKAVIQACGPGIVTQGQAVRQVKGRAEAVEVFEIVAFKPAEDNNE